MTFVVAEPCIACKYTDCVDVCPVDCFYEGENFLVIHPEECIRCGACEPVCPTEAIFVEEELPERYQEYLELNRKLAEEWPLLSVQQDPLPDAEQYKGVADKRDMLSEKPAPRD